MKALPESDGKRIVFSGRDIDQTGKPLSRGTEEEPPLRAAPSPLFSALLNRAKLDFLASLLTLIAAAMCLGVALMFFGIRGQVVHLEVGKLERWVSASLPIGAIFVFGLSYRRMTPWFAGILAALMASLVPGMSISMQLILVVLLSVAFGTVDAWVRWRGGGRG